MRLRAGIVDRAWANRLSLEGFVSGYTKELQHAPEMRVPYGEVEYGQTVFGASARYEVGRSSGVSLSVVGSYAHHDGHFSDPATWVYDWYGDRVRQRLVSGEVSATGSASSSMTRDDVFARALVRWQVARGHALRVSLTPQLSTTRNSTSPGPASEMLTVVTGAEYEADLFDQVVSNVVFIKDYIYQTSGQGRSRVTSMLEPFELSHHAFGGGDALCLRATPWLRIKASYEYANRLPSDYEVFGDGLFTIANLQLEPEVSHNLNLGPQLSVNDTAVGSFSANINAFRRDTDRQIVLLAAETAQYMNLSRSRSFGFDSSAGWTSHNRFVSLGGTVSWQDLRSVSSDGPFEQFKGERIPNRPYLFGSWNARVRIPGLPRAHGTLEPYYYGRYIHDYLRSWEGQGLRQFKLSIDDQVTHTVGLTWNIAGAFGHAAATVEVSNLTDAKVYDLYGVQRPGRAFYIKLTGEI